MGEVDYQLALILQHKFETETDDSRKRAYLADSQFAKSLQEHFEKEAEVEVTGQKLSYATKKSINTTKSLVDPSWEVIDPTPDIYALFMSFNERFFWNKLLAVCISWSKRMTSCAGICSYQGRGGMCSITISEPLLKLRPRKDLVETMLHEMIHAYLFVTNNNRDRDGHGPEFQKHMFRINAESGTNITIYHDFYDEVKLYKQHWWKCDGPCQNRKPYYGMVKRAMNRAPGPHDFWWGEHFRSCGGNFVKVKEPEKKGKKIGTLTNKNKPDKAVVSKPLNDITTFFPSSTSRPKGMQGIKSSTGSVTSTVTTKNLKAISSSEVDHVISRSGNIFGFTNLGGTSSRSKSESAVTDISSINSSATGSTNPKLLKATANGNILKKVGTKDNNVDYMEVRNTWLKKFPNNSSPTRSSVKRTSWQHLETLKNSREKIPKMSEEKFNSSVNDNTDSVPCPVCEKLFDINEVNVHIDDCLQNNEASKKCIICEVMYPTNEYEKHVIECTNEHFQDDVFEVPSNAKNKKTETKSKDVSDSLVMCEVCEEMVEKKCYELHLNDCLNKMYDKIESNYFDQTTSCLACDIKIPKDELYSHLDVCASMSRIFDDKNDPVQDS